MLEFDKPADFQGEALEGEIRAAGWSDAQVSVEGPTLRVVGVPDGDRDGVKTVIDDHVPPDPPPDPDEELSKAVTTVRDNASSQDVVDLCDALLGNMTAGMAAGKPTS